MKFLHKIERARETLCVVRDTFRGKETISVRLFYEKDGELRPTQKGVTFNLEDTQELLNVGLQLLKAAGAEIRYSVDSDDTAYETPAEAKAQAKRVVFRNILIPALKRVGDAWKKL